MGSVEADLYLEVVGDVDAMGDNRSGLLARLELEIEAFNEALIQVETN